MRPKRAADIEGRGSLYWVISGVIRARQKVLRLAEATDSVVDFGDSGAGYGYQWWRYDRGDVEVWAGNGFGGQFLVVLPAERMVGVINSWNVFGDRVGEARLVQERG